MNNIQRCNAAFIGGLLAITYNLYILLFTHPEIPGVTNTSTIITASILPSFVTGFLLVYLLIFIDDFFFGFPRRRIKNTIHTSAQEKRKEEKSYQSNK